jgi:murein DD-endopeptidase MepM/ murein hydrolase activator NlpD
MTTTAIRTSRAFLACALACTLAFPLVGTPSSAYAETSTELHEQAEDLQAQADEISARIEELSNQMVEARNVEDEAMEKYDAAEAAKQDALDRKEAAEVKIAETQTRLSARVTAMYRSGGATSLLDVLLGASSFEAFLTTWDALEAINNQDAALVEESRTAKEEAEAAATEYAEQSAIAQEELERAQEASQQIADASAELAEELASMNDEIADLVAREEQAAAEEEEARQAAEAAASGSGSSTWTDPGSGGELFDSSVFDGWVKPTSYYGVTCEFGYSPITGSHNGIDLGASSGTPIYSAGPGTVTYVGWYGTGGNAVIVDHGGGVQTIYMHQSQTAAYVGESVEAGTCIGYVGSTGLSTGPHLHFQLVINGTPTNPRNYFSF